MRLLRRILPGTWPALVILACFLPLSGTPSSYPPQQQDLSGHAINLGQLLSGSPTQQGLSGQVRPPSRFFPGQSDRDNIQAPCLLALPRDFSVAENAMTMPPRGRFTFAPSPLNLPKASASGGASPAANISGATVIAYLVYLVPLFAITVIIASLRVPVARWLKIAAGLVWLTVPFIVPFIASKVLLYSFFQSNPAIQQPAPSLWSSNFFSGFRIDITDFGIGEWIIIFASICMFVNLEDMIRQRPAAQQLPED